MAKWNIFSTQPSLSERVKLIGGKDNVIHSSVIPMDINFPGFYLNNFILPRIRIKSSKNSRTDVISRLDSDSPITSRKSYKLKTEEKHSSIEFSSLFASGNDLRVFLTAENSVDNSVLFQHIIFEWSNNRLWSNKFSYIFRVDLSVMLRPGFFAAGSFQGTHEEIVARLIHNSLDNPTTVSIEEIEKHLLSKDKMSKTLILCDGIGKTWHLINFSHNSPYHSKQDLSIIKGILNTVLNYPKVILNANNHISEMIERNYGFNLILENTGFLKSDFRRYIEAHFSGVEKDRLLEFIRQNHHLNEIKSPSILKMICYILTKSDGVNLKSVSNSATLSSLYYDMLSLMSSEFSSNHGMDCKKSVIHFMQELAFNTVTKTRFILADLIKKHQNEEMDIISLVTDFKLVQYEPKSLDISDACVFKDVVFRDFMAASYLRKLLISGGEDDIDFVKLFLAQNQDKLEFLRVIKFLSGLISLINEEEIKKNVMSIFWSAFSLTIPDEMVINGDEKYILTMELLSQNIVDGRIDPFIPSEAVDNIDDIIISDIEKWRSSIIKTQYSSSKVISFLKDFLDSEDIKICLVAIELLPILNIRNQEIKEEIANNLISKIRHHSSLEVIEASIRSLVYLEDFPIVEDFLKEILGDTRYNIILATIEVISNVADVSYLGNLYSKLEDSNPWVVCAAMEAIRKISLETKDRELFNNVILKILSFPKNYDQIIVDKALDLFSRIRMSPELIFNKIKLDIEGVDYSKLIGSLSALQSLIKFQIKFDYNQIFKDLEKKIISYNSFFHHYSQEEYSIEKEILKIFGDIYSKLSKANKEEVYSCLKSKLGSKNEDIKIMAIQVLGSIKEHRSETLRLLEEKMTNSRYISAKIESMKIIGSMLNDVSERNQNLMIISAVKATDKTKDQNFIVTAISFINKILQQSITIEARVKQYQSTLITKLLNKEIDKYSSNEVKFEVVSLIANNINLFNREEVSQSFGYIQELFSNNIDKKLRIELILALGKIYSYFPDKIEIINLLLLDGNMKSNELEIRNEVIKAFEEILLFIPIIEHASLVSQPTLFIRLQEKLKDPTYLHKIFLINILSKFDRSVINLSPSFIGDLIVQISSSGSNEVSYMATKYLVDLYKDGKDTIKKVFNHFIKLLLNKTGNLVDYRYEESTIIAIGVLIKYTEIKSKDIDVAVTLLLKEIDSKSSLLEVSLFSLGEMLSSLSKNKLLEVANSLVKINSLEIMNKNILETILAISCDLIKNDRIPFDHKEGLRNLAYRIIEKKIAVYNSQNTEGDLIDDLIIKYSNKLTQLSLEDGKTLEILFEIIFLRALESDNHLVQNSLFYLLSRSEINIDKLFVLLEYKLSNCRNIFDKNRVLNLVRNKFLINEYTDDDYKIDEFNDKLLDLEKLINPDVIDLFPDTQSILNEPENFSKFIKKYGLSVRVTIDYIEVLEKKYSLMNVDDLSSQANDAKIIIMSLIESEKQDGEKIVATEHMFSEFTNTHLIEGKVQFSILHQVTNNEIARNLVNVILVFEEMTVFGYIIIKVVTIYNKQVLIEYHKSIDKNYKQNIFGDPTEDYFYHIKSVSINPEEVDIILGDTLYECESSVCLVRSAIESLEMPELSREYSHDWKKSIAVSRSTLVGLNSYMQELKELRERQDITEDRVKELENKVVELTKGFDDFVLSQESINELALFLHKQENPGSMEGLTPYQASVARTIMFELDALYTAAKVVYKDRVANAQTGAAGSIAKLFSMIGDNIPVVGPAVNFATAFLSAYDANVQARIAANIIKLAPSGGRAERIIDKIAIACAKGDLHLDQLPEEGLFEKIFVGISAIENLQGMAIDSIVGFFASKMEKGKIVDSEVAKGKLDGEQISNILIAIISSGQCDEVAWQKNDQVLLNYFSDNGYIDFPVIQSPLLLSPPPQEDKAFKGNENTYTDIEMGAALCSGALMKAAEIWPSTKYLLTNWVPIMPLMKKLGISSDFIEINEHKITTAIYTVGSVSFTYFTNGNPYVAISAGVLFNMKPYIYGFQNNILEAVFNSEDTNGYVKFGLYVVTEAALTVVSVPLITHPYDLAKMIINNPIEFINDPTTKMGLMQGSFTGAIKYLSHLTQSEGNIIGSIISFPVPLAVSYFSYNYFQELSSNGEVPNAYIILISANTVSEAAFAHYSTKIVGDYVGEKVLDYIGQDSLSITNSSEL